MSQYAKSLIAAIAAVLIAGVQAWQVAVAGQPFRLIDLLPVVTATSGTFYTYLVPEVPELDRAKTWVASGFAVLTALTTAVTGHPADVTVLNLLIAGLSAAVIHAVPNGPSAAALTALTGLGKPAADVAAGHADLGEITDALRQLEQADAAAAHAPIPAVPAPAVPLPIEAEALAASTSTQAFPAVLAAG